MKSILACGIMVLCGCSTHLQSVDSEAVQVSERLLMSNLRCLSDAGPCDLRLVRMREEAIYCNTRGIERRAGVDHEDGGPTCK